MEIINYPPIRRRRRYDAAEKIERQIDLTHALIKLHADAIAAMEAKIKAAIVHQDQDPHVARRLREECNRRQACINRLTETRLVRLKAKLAEFRTPALPGLVPDQTIPVV